MKKILLLGGSSQQVIAIQAAKNEGLYTILCDFLPDNPGRLVADEFYLASTTDKEAILSIAKKEKIDAIVAYSSDPAAPTAAFVSEQLGLPGVPYSTAKAFCEKHLFRRFLEENDFNVPRSEYVGYDDVFSLPEGMNFPVIVKPTDSSGSKGVTVVFESDSLKAALDCAAQYSRNKVLIIEEFIQRDHPDVIEAEIFVINGKVVTWGLMSSIRDFSSNPLLPAAYSYPASISEERFDLVKENVSRLVQCSKVKNGAFNIEMVITCDNKLYFVDAGPRNGGNMLPEFIGAINHQDLVKATILAATGELDCTMPISLDGKEGGFWGLSVIHSSHNGILEGITYSAVARKCLYKEHIFAKIGEPIGKFDISRNAIGLAFFHFPSEEMQNAVLRDFGGEHIRVKLKDME